MNNVHFHCSVILSAGYHMPQNSFSCLFFFFSQRKKKKKSISQQTYLLCGTKEGFQNGGQSGSSLIHKGLKGYTGDVLYKFFSQGDGLLLRKLPFILSYIVHSEDIK